MHTNQLNGMKAQLDGKGTKFLGGKTRKLNTKGSNQNTGAHFNVSGEGQNDEMVNVFPFGEDTPHREIEKVRDQANSSIHNDIFVDMMQHPEWNVMYTRSKTENNCYKKNALHNDESEVLTKKKSLPLSFNHKSNYVNKEENGKINETTFMRMNKGESENTDKILSFRDLKKGKSGTEGHVGEFTAEGWPNGGDKPSGHNDTDKFDQLKEKNNQNEQVAQSVKNTQPYLPGKKEESATNDRMTEEKNYTQKRQLHGHNLKKKKKKSEKIQNEASKFFNGKELHAKNTRAEKAEEARKEKEQKEKEKGPIKKLSAAKINDELSVLELRKEKNREIRTKFEKISLNSQGKKEHTFGKLNNNQKCSDGSQKESSEEQIMIQKIFIQESDTDDVVQRKVNSIEHILEETEKRNMNNSLKRVSSFKTGKGKEIENGTTGQSVGERTNVGEHLCMHSLGTTSLSSFSPLEEEIGEEKDIGSVNKVGLLKGNRKNQSTGLFYDNMEEEKDEESTHILNSPLGGEVEKEVKRKINKKGSYHIQSSEHCNTKNVESINESGRTSSGSSDELVDIKIYDDSEIEEAKESELDKFWLNRQVSSLLNKSKLYSAKYSDEFNSSTAKCSGGNYINGWGLPTGEEYSQEEGTNRRIISPKMKRYESDIFPAVKSGANFFQKRNTTDNIEMRERAIILEEHDEGGMSRTPNRRDRGDAPFGKYTLSRNDTTNRAEKEGSMEDMASRIDAIKKKLSLINNTDIDLMNFENFDMYQIDFDKLGLKVDNLEKEEKYILMLYMSEKKVEYLRGEKGAHKMVHVTSEAFPSNYNKMVDVGGAILGGDGKSVPMGKSPSGISSGESDGSDSSDGGFLQLGLLVELYRKLSKQQSMTSKVEDKEQPSQFSQSSQIVEPRQATTKNEKILLKKVLANFVYLFLQDECLDKVVRNYENMKQASGKEEAKRANSKCLHYICSSLLQDISSCHSCEEKDPIGTDISGVFYKIVKEIGSKILSNDKLMGKIKQVQIINSMLREEVRTYSIKVAYMDKFLDIEPHFIEEAEKVVLGDDIGFFRMHTLNMNYNYNYHTHGRNTKLLHQNSNPVWNFFYAYFNDIYNWYSDKNGRDFSPQGEVQNAEMNKDMASSKRVSRNFIKVKDESSGVEEGPLGKDHKEVGADQGPHNQNESNSTRNEMAPSSPLEWKSDKGSNQFQPGNSSSHTVEDKQSEQQKYLNKDREDAGMESFNIIGEKKYLANVNSVERTILSNSTKIGECPLGSNTSSVDNLISSEYNNLGNSGSNGDLTSFGGDHLQAVQNDMPPDGDCIEDELGSHVTHKIGTDPPGGKLSNSHTPVEPKTESIPNNKKKKQKEDIEETHLVSFQYKGSIPKGEMNLLGNMSRDKNKNIIGCYLSAPTGENLIAIQIKNEKIENVPGAHFLVERCNKYNNEFNNSFVHILNSRTKRYLAVDLENGKFLFTGKYDDVLFTDERNVEHRVCTYFQLQSISDLMKSVIIEDLVQSMADLVLR
ncbi:conserved Plasmodium protein, unknown function [Plasmodium knowlesi strain H]|uniref:Uncharacterized protein n=3 Tax=Plasmodium knowlesi TaxID=5850 RepID=A0A5K1VBD4_PLAKH|nr:conserved Plasmodium protein, unknown function [Plasmodium knowlesi strain H]OTN63647.1 Uncharacterized protein PKNOH_S140236800 [Plasmodium knowlesi]CAA9990790.1 conserved Plasmodium protein, unknown function [Plasmodium knowlesi strain H]SBO21070.1 conserved Plasmodium protein, unknown function [Plasmodium knowlesi strain H]SBO21551.1 conserved Plasmodium protein, unknown function [Plasmodium knowlesi strain H]VVS80264.1 conserved Plasmodium protein, unknown function [Plasmodium knowlesi |eukprot:XP_002262079.1 hypothetical protein, conserved in Plasmodium species [Plasmodium knowlesi strain H]